MRVAKLVQPRQIELFKEPDELFPRVGEAVVSVKVVGICGTDIHIFEGHRSDVVLPRVMGHELSGEVFAVGEGVQNVRVGDRVVLDPVMACGECAVCRSGHENVCADVKCYGVQMDGGFQDRICIPAKQLYRVPDSVSYLDAALIEPFSIASNILHRAQARAGEKLVVIGAGTIGLAVMQAAKGMGLEVLISDVVEKKLEKACAMEANAVVHGGREDLAERVRAFAPNGPDIVLDAVGTAKLFEQSVALCGPTGRIVVIGFDGTPAGIAPVHITKKELTITGSRMNAHRFPEALKWFADGAVNPANMVDEVFPLEEIQRAFEVAASNPTLAKILIVLQ